MLAMMLISSYMTGAGLSLNNLDLVRGSSLSGKGDKARLSYHGLKD